MTRRFFGKAVSGSAVALLGVSLMLLGGCASRQIVTRTDPVIVPNSANITGARLGVFSFRTPWNDRVMESRMAHKLHQLLLTRRASRVIEVIPEGYRDLNMAIDRARVLGYDVAVFGQIQEAFWGGDTEPSKATVDLRLVDVVRRVTIWYLSSSARSEPESKSDYLLWRSTGQAARLPMELVNTLMIQLVDRLAAAAPTVPSLTPVPPKPPLELKNNQKPQPEASD